MFFERYDLICLIKEKFYLVELLVKFAGSTHILELN